MEGQEGEGRGKGRKGHESREGREKGGKGKGRGIPLRMKILATALTAPKGQLNTLTTNVLE